jgi:hypothetical protein
MRVSKCASVFERLSSCSSVCLSCVLIAKRCGADSLWGSPACNSSGTIPAALMKRNVPAANPFQRKRRRKRRTSATSKREHKTLHSKHHNNNSDTKKNKKKTLITTTAASARRPNKKQTKNNWAARGQQYLRPRPAPTLGFLPCKNHESLIDREKTKEEENEADARREDEDDDEKKKGGRGGRRRRTKKIMMIMMI